MSGLGHDPLSQLGDIFAWWRHQMETFSALLSICAGNSPVTGEFLTQRPVTRRFDVSLICAWINGWVHNRKAGDLGRHRAHCDVTVMSIHKAPYTVLTFVEIYLNVFVYVTTQRFLLICPYAMQWPTTGDLHREHGAGEVSKWRPDLSGPSADFYHWISIVVAR